MQPISDTLLPLKQSIEADLSVATDEKGYWYIEGYGMRLLRWLFNTDDRRMERVVETFVQHLDALERGKSHEVELSNYQVALAICQHYRQASNIWKLAYRVRALEFRLKLLPSESPTKQLEQNTYILAKEWKKRQTYLKHHELTSDEKNQLNALTEYPTFAKTLFEYPELQNSFFEWTLRDRNCAASFIHLPGTVSHIRSSFKLSSRLGTYNLLRFEHESMSLHIKYGGEKTCDLRQIDCSMTFSHGHTVTVRELLHDFYMRQKTVGNFEATPEGIVNHNNKAIGPYDPATQSHKRVDLDCEKWWQQLRPADELSPEKLRERLGNDWQGKPLQLDGEQWVFSVGANTENNQKVLMEGNHGYLLVAIPNKEGNYFIYPFGKFTDQDWPETFLQRMPIAFSYLPGSIYYPDENYFYTERDCEYSSVAVTPNAALKMMYRICKDIRDGWEKRLPFQIFDSNCLEWATDVVKEHIPHAYFKKLAWGNPFDIGCDGLYGTLAEYYKSVPKWLINPVLDRVASFFGSHKIMHYHGVAYSFSRHRPWDGNNHEFPNPSLLLLRKRGVC